MNGVVIPASRYVEIDGVEKPFHEVKRGDRVKLYESDGTLIWTGLALSGAYIGEDGYWTFIYGEGV